MTETQVYLCIKSLHVFSKISHSLISVSVSVSVFVSLSVSLLLCRSLCLSLLVLGQNKNLPPLLNFQTKLGRVFSLSSSFFFFLTKKQMFALRSDCYTLYNLMFWKKKKKSLVLEEGHFVYLVIVE